MMRVLRVSADVFLEGDGVTDMTPKEVEEIKAEVARYYDAVVIPSIKSLIGAHHIQEPDDRRPSVHWHESSDVKTCRACVRMADDEIGG